MEDNLQKNENEIANNNNNKNGIIVLLVVIIIALIGAVVYFAFIKKDDKPVDNNGGNNQANNEQTKDNEKKYNNTFVYDTNGSYGVAYATGYAKVQKEYYCEAVAVDECNESNADEINDVVYFYVTNTDSEDFKKEIDEWFGGQSKDTQSIQLGCLKDNIIEFVSFADDYYHGDDEQKSSPEYYAKLISVSNEDSSKILSSSESNQITLKMEKLKYSAGFATDGYTCLSKMTSIEIAK